MFAHVVTLYRAAGRPPLAGDRFSYLGATNTSLDATVSTCEQLDPGFGHFADGPDHEAGDLDFTWSLSSNESGRFFTSPSDFVARCESLHRGEFPRNFYIAELDYFDGDTEAAQIPALETVNCLCELIRLLADLSLSGNLAGTAGRPAHLVFVKPASTGTPPVTVEITTRIEAAMLLMPAPDLDILRDLLSPQSKGKVRTEEYKAVFRLAVADACGTDTPEELRFGTLLNKWDSVIRRFRYDVECVVDRMSFDVLRREIVEAELNFVSRVNTSVVDNAAKFLGIPVSLVAVAAVASGESLAGDVLVCLGAVVVAIVVSGVAKATRFQLATTTTAFESVLASMRARARADGDVANSIKTLGETYHRRCAFAKRVAGTFQIVAWLPPLIALSIIAWKFPAPWTTNFIDFMLSRKH